MACFLVPMAEAIVITVVKKAVEKKEKEAVLEGTSQTELSMNSQTRLSWSRKLGWLNKLLWGGVFLLAMEHLWHGEIVPWPPFLTAMNNPADVGPMLHEVAIFGTTMAIFVTIVWAIIILVADQKAKTFPTIVKTDI